LSDYVQERLKTSIIVRFCTILSDYVQKRPITPFENQYIQPKSLYAPKTLKKRPGTSITPKNVRQCPLTYNWIRISIGGRLNMQLMIARWSLELMMSFIFII